MCYEREVISPGHDPRSNSSIGHCRLYTAARGSTVTLPSSRTAGCTFVKVFATPDVETPDGVTGDNISIVSEKHL